MFIDTNILVQARVMEGPHHQAALNALGRALQSDDPLHISRQIIREYLSALTRPQTWTSPISLAVLLDDAEQLSAMFTILEDGPLVTERFVALCREIPVGGRQVHDANIVATMLAHDERRLLTLNTSHFRRYSDRIELASV